MGQLGVFTGLNQSYFIFSANVFLATADVAFLILVAFLSLAFLAALFRNTGSKPYASLMVAYSSSAHSILSCSLSIAASTKLYYLDRASFYISFFRILLRSRSITGVTSGTTLFPY